MNPQALLSSFSVAMLAIAIWGHFPIGLDERPVLRRAAVGAVMGLGAVGAMMVPMQIEPGLFYDMRTPLLAAAAFVGGPVSAVVAGVLGLAYRLHVGGIGIWAGSASIVSTCLVGAAVHAATRRRAVQIVDVALVAIAVTMASFSTIFLLPRANWTAALQHVGPVTLLTLCCTALFILSLRRDESHRRLIATNNIYRAIIEALPDSLNAKDRRGRFVAANPATARLMRAQSADDLLGKSDMDFYPPTVAQGFRDEELQVLSNAIMGPLDQEVEFPDGSRRWLTTLKTPLLDHAGNVQGIITHNRDVTDRKKLEIELLAVQTHLQEAMTNMADGLVLYDADGVIRFCNEQYRTLFPSTADLRVPGARFADILRASVLRGEEAPKTDIEEWVAERTASLHRSGDRLIELQDGRYIEVRTRQVAGADILIVFTDVTARKRLEHDLLRRASHDPLTGLPNRAEFEFQLKAAFSQANAQGTEVAVMMMDLDRFKQVNDTFGHAVGDKLLVEVAARLQAATRFGDVVARLGGDEFAFILSAATVAAGASSLAERVLRNLGLPFCTDGIDLTPGGSLGVACFPKDARDPIDLLKAADTALYSMKARGGGGWAFVEAL